MITQTYIFRDLPKWLRENTDGKRDRFIAGIAEDIKWEFESSKNPPQILSANMDVTGYDLLCNIQVDPADARYLECALHNLHSASLINLWQ